MFGAWISNFIDIKVWDVITHLCPNVKGGLIKPPLKLGRGWVNYSHKTMDVIIYPCPNLLVRGPKVDWSEVYEKPLWYLDNV